ncbi:MAG: superoxide dismutase [Candidatus Kapaibacterium sp.]
MDSKRRNFLAAAGGLTAAAMVGGGAGSSKLYSQSNEGGRVTKHELMPLPYDYDALEPYIDAQTMRLHHDMHHQGYVNGLNKAEEALAKMRVTGDYSMAGHWTRQLAFNGAGDYLHRLFWSVMSPNGGGSPIGILAQKINNDFGSFDNMKAQFRAAAKTVQGSGWGILAHRPRDNRLVIFAVHNHEKYFTQDSVPLICLDVWEHAYYLKYQNKRGEYIDNWWNVVNWEEASKNYQVHEE